MKIGVRKPSVKKSIKARTTGRAKRAVKKAVTPGYGKKGMGWVKNPKKAAYNKVYNKTTIGVSALAAGAVTSSTKSGKKKRSAPMGPSRSQRQVSGPAGNAIRNYDLKIKGKPSMAAPVVLLVLGALLLIALPVLGVLVILLGLYYLFSGRNRIRKGDYATPDDLDEWRSLLEGYGIETAAGSSILAMANATIPILEESYSALMAVYKKLDTSASLKNADMQNLLICSAAVLDFQKYLTPKKPAIVYPDNLIISRRTEAVEKFIDAEYAKAVAHAQTLKTDTGKANQADHFRKAMADTFSELWPDCLAYAEEKVDLADFVH